MKSLYFLAKHLATSFRGKPKIHRILGFNPESMLFQVPLVSACLIFMAAFEFADALPHLAVTDYDTGKTLVSFSVRYGGRFTIRYIHSVDLSPVFETFRVDREKGIILEETRFRMFGAGMGHWEGRGDIVQDGKWIKIVRMNQPLGSFILRIGSKGVDHTIITADRTVNLSNIAAGRRVEISVVD